MDKIIPGQILHDVREYYGIAKSSISHGLCSDQYYYRIECGVKEPDGLLFACLWERMGLSLSRVSVLLSDEEVEWFFLKADAYNAVRDKDIHHIRSIRKRLEAIKKLNSSIQMQFIDYLVYAEMMIGEGFSEAAYRIIRSSVMRTCENPLKTDFLRFRFGQEEIQLICAFYIAEYRQNPESLPDIKEGLKRLNKYASEQMSDISARAEALSRIASAQIKLFGDDTDWETVASDVEIIRKVKGIYDMPTILEALGKRSSDRKEQYRRWGETLLWLYDEFGSGYKYREEMIYPQLPHINEVSDFIKTGRISKRLTQEKISEGICEPESYSRIETGVRKAQKRNLKQIVNKLDLEWGYFQGLIITSEYRCLQKRIEVDEALKHRDFDRFNAAISELERMVNADIPQNKQYFIQMRVLEGLKRGTITPESAIEQLSELLRLTEATGELIRYYSPHESAILLLMAKILRNYLHRGDEAMIIADRFIQNESRKKLPDVWRIYQFKRIVAGINNDLNDWNSEVAVSLDCIRYSLTSGFAGMLEQFLDLYAEGLGQGKIKNDYERRLLVAAIYMADLYNEQSNSQRFKRYLINNFGMDDTWY